jgi:hypothetical protein
MKQCKGHEMHISYISLIFIFILKENYLSKILWPFLPIILFNFRTLQNLGCYSDSHRRRGKPSQCRALVWRCSAWSQKMLEGAAIWNKNSDGEFRNKTKDPTKAVTGIVLKSY